MNNFYIKPIFLIFALLATADIIQSAELQLTKNLKYDYKDTKSVNVCLTQDSEIIKNHFFDVSNKKLVNINNINCLFSYTCSGNNKNKYKSFTIGYISSNDYNKKVFISNDYVMPVEENNQLSIKKCNTYNFASYCAKYIIINNKKEKNIIYFYKIGAYDKNFSRDAIATALNKNKNDSIVKKLVKDQGPGSSRLHFFSGLLEAQAELKVIDVIKLINMSFSDSSLDHMWPYFISLNDIETWVVNKKQAQLSLLQYCDTQNSEDSDDFSPPAIINQNNGGINEYQINPQNTSTNINQKLEKYRKIIKEKTQTIEKLNKDFKGVKKDFNRLHKFYMASCTFSFIIFLYLCYRDIPLYFGRVS